MATRPSIYKGTAVVLQGITDDEANLLVDLEAAGDIPQRLDDLETGLGTLESTAITSILPTTLTNGVQITGTGNSRTVNVTFPVTDVQDPSGTSLVSGGIATVPDAPVQSVSMNGTAVTPDANGNVALTAITAVQANGTALTPSAGAINVVPGSSQITVSGSGNTLTIDANIGQVDTYISSDDLLTASGQSSLAIGDLVPGLLIADLTGVGAASVANLADNDVIIFNDQYRGQVSNIDTVAGTFSVNVTQTPPAAATFTNVTGTAVFGTAGTGTVASELAAIQTVTNGLDTRLTTAETDITDINTELDSKLTGVTMNGTAAAVTAGVAALTAVTGVTVNGTATTVTAGVAAITNVVESDVTASGLAGATSIGNLVEFSGGETAFLAAASAVDPDTFVLVWDSNA